MTAAVAATAIPAVVERVGRVLDDRVYEHTVVRTRAGRTVTKTLQVNGWHLLGAAAVASAAVWAGFALGALGWRRYEWEVERNGKKEKVVIHLPAAVSKGNERLGLRPYDIVTGSWLSPLRLLFP